MTLRTYLPVGYMLIFFLVLEAAAQTTVTTSGGSTNSLPKFSSASSVVDSAVTETNGNMSLGPVVPAANPGQSGVFSASGNTASLGFVRRTLTLWPQSPAAGDAWFWYNPDGTARLWTYQTGDVLTIQNSGNMFLGPFPPTSFTGGPGIFLVTGDTAALSFARRTLTSWPQSPAAGDGWTWYNPDGTARLWTYQVGDALIVKTDGEVDLTGPIRFSDGSLQTKAQAVGPQGPQGIQGPAGPQGPPGPTLHSSASCFNSSQPITSCGCSRTISASFVSNGNTCFVTSDTGSCNAGSTATPPQFGACCSCAL